MIYQLCFPRELSFKKGDYIILRRQIDNNWFEGEHNARVGLLPIKYVEVRWFWGFFADRILIVLFQVMTKDLNKRPKTPSEGQARAKYSFNAQSAVELSLNKGELVTLTRRVDSNWFEGKIANRKGIFPVNYVEVSDLCSSGQVAVLLNSIFSVGADGHWS